MKLKVILPCITDRWTGLIQDEYRAVADPGTEIAFTNLKRGPESIECDYDEEMAAPFVLEEIVRAEQEGCDGVLVFCFGNTAVSAAREAVRIPVIGIGEVSQLIAMALGDQFSILSPLPHAVARHTRKARAMGTSVKLASIRPLNLPVLAHDRAVLAETLVKRGRQVIEEDGAEVIVLGCGTIFGLEKHLEEALGVPVVNSAIAGLKFLEMLVKLGLSHSKRTYLTPPEKLRII